MQLVFLKNLNSRNLMKNLWTDNKRLSCTAPGQVCSGRGALLEEVHVAGKPRRQVRLENSQNFQKNCTENNWKFERLASVSESIINTVIVILESRRIEKDEPNEASTASFGQNVSAFLGNWWTRLRHVGKFNNRPGFQWPVDLKQNVGPTVLPAEAQLMWPNHKIG